MGSGGGGGSNYDKAYNARMATIAEKNMAIAEQYFAEWKNHARHYERDAFAAQRQLLPEQTRLQTAQLQAQTRLVDQEELTARTGLARTQALDRFDTAQAEQASSLLGSATRTQAEQLKQKFGEAWNTNYLMGKQRNADAAELQAEMAASKLAEARAYRDKSLLGAEKRAKAQQLELEFGKAWNENYLLGAERNTKKAALDEARKTSRYNIAMADTRLDATRRLQNTADVNLQERMGEASANVAQEYGKALQEVQKSAGTFRRGQAQQYLRAEQAKSSIQAKNAARKSGRKEERENYNRLAQLR